MKYLYQYRKFEPYYLKALRNKTLQFSLYKTMDGQDELYFCFENIKRKTTYKKEDLKNIEEVIKRHIKSSYYISCFSNKQITDKTVLEKLCGDSGFCAIYKLDDIKKAIRQYSFSDVENNLGTLNIKNVHYVNKPINLIDFVINVDKQFSKYKRDNITNEIEFKIIEDSMTKRVEKKIFNTFITKPTCSYKKEHETRIIFKKNSDLDEHVKLLDVKPLKVIIFNNKNRCIKNFFINFLTNENISYEFIDSILTKRRLI